MVSPFGRVRRKCGYQEDGGGGADRVTPRACEKCTTMRREYVRSRCHPPRRLTVRPGDGGCPTTCRPGRRRGSGTNRSTSGCFFDAEAASLTRLARFYVDDKTAAEDLVQEAFIRFARPPGPVARPERAAAYLRSIVINLARDHNRRGFVSWRHRPPAQTDAPSAAETAEERAERAAVVAALRALPRRQRDCVTLRYYYDLPVAEIAATLGLSVNTVKTHLQRGLDALGATLEADR